MKSADVFYFFSVNTFYEVTGDYPLELHNWINTRFPGHFEARYIDVGRGMLLMEYRIKPKGEQAQAADPLE